MQHKNEKKQKITDRSPAAKNGLLLHLPNLCSLAHYACPFPILSPCCNSTRMCGLWRLQSGFPERSWNNTRCWPSNTPPYSPGFHLPPSVEWMQREALWKGFKKRAGGKKPKAKSGDGTLQITETSLKTKGLCRQKWQQGARVWENFVTEPLVATKCHTLCATTKNKNRRGRRREAQRSYLQRELLQ